MSSAESITMIVQGRTLHLNREGYVDHDAEFAFTRGQCHALALMLHRLTGWKLYGFFCEYELENKATPGHVVVRTPSGSYVDITGNDALNNWLDYWPNSTPHPLTEAEVLGFEKRDYKKPNLEAAEPYALSLAMRYGAKAVQLRMPFYKGETAWQKLSCNG
jgi:hypothetical protein